MGVMPVSALTARGYFWLMKMIASGHTLSALSLWVYEDWHEKDGLRRVCLLAVRALDLDLRSLSRGLGRRVDAAALASYFFKLVEPKDDVADFLVVESGFGLDILK